MRHHFESLQKTGANNLSLSPLSFLRRAESLHGAHPIPMASRPPE